MSERHGFCRLATLARCVILTTLLFSVAAEPAWADPPKPRAKKNADGVADEHDHSGNPSKSSENASPFRTSREQNDGSLPPADDAPTLINEKARDARNWLDPQTTDSLRKLVLDAAKERRSRWPEYPALDPRKGAADNIRVVESGRILFYTDLPSSPEVDQIPDALDAAVPLLCEFFHADEEQFENWRVEAFLMRDVDAFIRFGALDGPPRFLYGYSDRDRIFAKDQKVGYYNRFLLMHELVHTFMHEYFGDLRPRWYSEGVAEYVALHQWSPRKGLQLAQIPESESAYPGFGRLRQLKEILKSNRAPTIFEIMNLEPRDYVHVSSYAWSWAMVMFLYNSPKYQDVAQVLPFWMVANDPNGLFVDAIGDRWAELEYDWADFLNRLDYGYDFEATAIELEPSSDAPPNDEALRRGVVVSVDPKRGWQSSGIVLEAGRRYKLTVGGRFDFYLEGAKRVFSFEGTGATVEYCNELPAGRVLAVVVPEPGKRAFDEVYHYEESNVDKRTSGFRFDAFRNTRHTRFGVDSAGNATGFSDGFLADVKSNDRARSAESSKEARFDFYNALYPWNEALDFASVSLQIAPKTSGTLYLCVNAPARNLKRNSGNAKVQVKTAE